MPQRPRSHQLEDISIARLRAAVPPAWVVRERSRDYGIDLEIEIFTQEGFSTGILFYVQLRATDDPSRARETRFKLDQLEYFRVLDLPTAIVRYSSTDDALYLKWGFEVDPAAGGAKTQKVVFADTDRWSDETAEVIVQTLSTLRKLRFQEAFLPFAFELTNICSDADRSYEIQVAFEQLSVFARGISSKVAEDAGGFTVQVRADDNNLKVGIDRIAEINVADGLSDRPLLGAISYSVLLLLWRLGLRSQAQRVAKWVIEANIAPPSAQLGLMASLALLPNANAAVEAACRADIHKKQDENFLILVAAIQNACRADEEVEARITFNLRAIASGAYDGYPTSKAALHYSTANMCRRAGKFSEAARHYLKAVRLRPDYSKSGYFWAELGGCLYMRRKFAVSAKVYEVAYSIDPGPHLALLTGDAKMCAGEVGRAAELFKIAEVEPSPLTPGEAAVKAHICRSLTERWGASFARPISQLEPLWARAESERSWLDILAIDPLDPLANFNVGVGYADASHHEQAFWHFLTVAVLQPGDEDAWANAIGCALRTDATLLGITLHLALFHCGRSPYEMLRSRLVKAGVTELLPDLDSTVRDILLMNTEMRTNTLAIRIFDGKDFRHVFDVPGR